MQSPRKIVHIHVPKTAGTAIRMAFQKSFGNSLRVAPHVTERNADELMIEGFDFYSGHIGYETAARIGGEVITVLRNPVDRVVSTYYFWRQLYETGVERTVKTLLATKYPLDEFLAIKDEVQLSEEFFNRTTWQLACGSSTEARRAARADYVSDDELLAQAIRNVSEFAVVGIHENLNGFVRQLKDKFSVDLEVDRINVTKDRIAASELPVRIVRQIYEWVYLDVELYQKVCADAA